MTTEAQKIQDIGSWTEDGDFKFIDSGSIWLVQPQNDHAAEWLEEESRAAFLAGLDWQFFGRSLVIEPRYLDNMLVLLDDEGWRVS